MEREVSDSIKISITLLLMAALISIVWFTVRIGNNIKNDTFESSSNLAANMESSQLNSIKYKEGLVVPKVSVYNLINQESSVVTKVIYITSTKNGDKYELTYNGEKWEAELGGIKYTYSFAQDILADTRFNGGLTGRSEVYAEPNGDNTYTVSVTDIKV